MDYENLKKILAEKLGDSPKIQTYISHLKELETAKNKDGKNVNYWFKDLTENQAIELYLKVLYDGLYIDGSTISLGYRGGINPKFIITYNYQAYKNKLLIAYPETTFDIQLVKENDVFEGRKENGKVIYKHILTSPFDSSKKILGGYCVIKNNRGEFLETIDMQEIEKMRNASLMPSIWKEWFSEMVYKSLLKRACKRSFNDLVVNIESMDNENYELENVSVDYTWQEKIKAATTEKELGVIYKESNKELQQNADFLRLLSERKLEILNDQPAKMEIKKEIWGKFVESYKAGKVDFDYLDENYFLTDEQKAELKEYDTNAN